MNKQDVLDYIELHKDDDWDEYFVDVNKALNKVNNDRKNKKKKAILPPPKEALEVAYYLEAEVKKRYIFAKTEPEKWAKDIDLINRIDKKDWQTINTIARFSQQDDFWQKNIRSGNKLRKHFDTLTIRTKEFYDRKLKDRVVSL